MHRHHAFPRQQVVQQREDRLLVFTGIGGVRDQDFFCVKIQRDHGLGAAAMPCRVGLEAGAIDDCPIRHETVEFRALGAAQQVADKQAVPRHFGNDADVETMRGFGTGVEVLDEVVAALHMCQHVFAQGRKCFGCHRRVVFPPDRVFDRGGPHNELVLWRPAGKLARRDEESSADPKASFAPHDGGFDKRGFDLVVIDRTQLAYALLFKSLGWVYTSVVHLLQAPGADDDGNNCTFKAGLS